MTPRLLDPSAVSEISSRRYTHATPSEGTRRHVSYPTPSHPLSVNPLTTRPPEMTPSPFPGLSSPHHLGSRRVTFSIVNYSYISHSPNERPSPSSPCRPPTLSGMLPNVLPLRSDLRSYKSPETPYFPSNLSFLLQQITPGGTRAVPDGSGLAIEVAGVDGPRPIPQTGTVEVTDSLPLGQSESEGLSDTPNLRY